MSMHSSDTRDQITDDFLILYLDTHLFSREGIFKCCYWYSNDYLIDLTVRGNFFKLVIRSKAETVLIEKEKFYAKLKQDLLDFQLREIITRQTVNVRDLLIAKAFANGELDQDTS